MSTETNKAIVRRLVEQVWNDRRIDLVEEFYGEDIVEHIAGMPPRSGLESVQEAVTMTFNAYPDFHLAIDDLIAEGDQIAMRWTMRGTHQGELMGIPATGKQVVQSGTSFFRLANARVAELWFLSDNLGLMQQLGVIPTPGVA